MTARFTDLESGWLFTTTLPPDVEVGLEWCHQRQRWLKQTAAQGQPPGMDPIPVDLPAPAGATEAERRADAQAIAEAHLSGLGR